MIETLFWVLIGCALGTITGLIPGLHINSVSFFVLALNEGQNQNLALMVVSMTIVHSFVNFIPSIFLGAPDDETFLSVLPGHYFLLKGKALHAIKLAVSGALFCAIICFISFPLLAAIIIKLDEPIKAAIPWVLLISVLLLIATEKEKIPATLLVAVSAALGIAVLNNPLVPNPLFPLISGFFGAPALILSAQKNSTIPKQKEKTFKINATKTIKLSVIAAIAGTVVSVVPSLGGAQATFLIKQFFQKISRTQFMVLLGGTSIANALFSLLFLFLTQKTRSDSAVVVKELLEINQQNFFLVASTALFACGVGALLCILIAKKAVKKMQSVNFAKLNKTVLAFLAIMCLASSGPFGLLAFASASCAGIFSLSFKIKRTACMSFLVVPTILFYLGLGA